MAEFGQLKKSSLPWAGYLMVKLTRSTYQLVQLFGEICETFKLNAFTYDEMKLKSFGKTLTAKAKACLFSHP